MTLIKVKVRDTGDIVFEGDVDRITSFNEMGQFDIYPGHANFISIIRKKLSFYVRGKKLKDIDFTQAVLKVKRDVCDIFLGIEELVIEDPKIK
jgi:F0F1-type ATP synthase epsilon subunit